MRTFIDTNIFVYSSYPQFPQFLKSREFLESCLKGADLWYLSWSVIYEYLAVVTQPEIFPGKRVTLDEAIQNILEFARPPCVEILQETTEHSSYLKELTQESHPVEGARFHDAHIVALMREHDLKRIATNDTDFHRFKEIEVVNPFL